MEEGWFPVDGVSSRFCTGFPAGHPQNARTTYAFSQSEGTPLIQTNEINVGHLVAHCPIPTFCVPQGDLDSADLPNSRITYTFGRSEHTLLIQTYKMKASHLVALCTIPTSVGPAVQSTKLWISMML